MTLPTTPDREEVRANWKRIAAKHAFSHNPEYLNEGSLDALIEFARTIRSEGLAEELNILKAARIWLRSALDCKTFLWDSDQHDAASEVCDALNDIVLAATVEQATRAEAEKGVELDLKVEIARAGLCESMTLTGDRGRQLLEMAADSEVLRRGWAAMEKHVVDAFLQTTPSAERYQALIDWNAALRGTKERV